MIFWSKRWAALAVAVVAPISLGGCLILPGEFVSAMTVRQNGEFSFSYKGQIQLVGLANLLNSGFMDDGRVEFKATCYSDDIEPASDNDDHKAGIDRDEVAAAANGKFSIVPANYVSGVALDGHSAAAGDASISLSVADATTEGARLADEASDTQGAMASWELTERECSPDEAKQQKTDWDEQQAEKNKRDEQSKKMAEMMLGGIDPENPETIVRFTREVERLAAWHQVEHLGNGLFMVDYSTSGKLADDHAFPVIPRYALGEPMIYITRWDNGRLRVEAPAFKTDPEMSIGTLIGLGSMAGGFLGKGSDKMPAEPISIKGSFTLTTDAPILANNSEEGPEESGATQLLRWDIGPAAYGAPMALLKLPK